MRITKKKLSFYVKIKKINGEVISRRSPYKTRVLNFIKATSFKFQWIYLLVTYKRGLFNDGKYYQNQKNELMNAWQSFTDEDLIRDVLSY